MKNILNSVKIDSSSSTIVMSIIPPILCLVAIFLSIKKVNCKCFRHYSLTLSVTQAHNTCIRSSGRPVGSQGSVGRRAQKSGHRLAASPYWITSSGLASVTFRAKKPSF